MAFMDESNGGDNYPAIDTRPFDPPMLPRTLLERWTSSPCFLPYAKEN